MSRRTDNLPNTARVLGFAGLIPFWALAIAMLVWPASTRMWQSLLANYALAIICFLVGIWWGLALIRRGITGLLLGNAIVIVAFISKSLLADHYFFLVAAALLVSIWVFEQRYALFVRQPAYYRRLRLQLTVVAAVSLVLGAGLLAFPDNVGTP